MTRPTRTPIEAPWFRNNPRRRAPGRERRRPASRPRLHGLPQAATIQLRAPPPRAAVGIRLTGMRAVVPTLLVRTAAVPFTAIGIRRARSQERAEGRVARALVEEWDGGCGRSRPGWGRLQGKERNPQDPGGYHRRPCSFPRRPQHGGRPKHSMCRSPKSRSARSPAPNVSAEALEPWIGGPSGSQLDARPPHLFPRPRGRTARRHRFVRRHTPSPRCWERTPWLVPRGNHVAVPEALPTRAARPSTRGRLLSAPRRRHPGRREPGPLALAFGAPRGRHPTSLVRQAKLG